MPNEKNEMKTIFSFDIKMKLNDGSEWTSEMGHRGGRDQQDHGSWGAQGNSSQTLSENIQH